jgi:hypothetical protein
MNNDMVVNKDQAVQTNLPARYPTPGTGHNPVSRSREIPASTRALASVPANAPQAKKKTMGTSLEWQCSFQKALQTVDAAAAFDNRE